MIQCSRVQKARMNIMIREQLTKLKDIDIYSLMLFALYKTKDIPEYASLSELVYILDKDSLLKLCEYFGGTTLKIPTIEQLESLVYALILYQYVNIEHMQYDEAVKLVGHCSKDLRNVKSDYCKLCKVLEQYDFTKRL